MPPEEIEKPGETEGNGTGKPGDLTGNNGVNDNKTEEKPAELPKTGNTMYFEMAGVIAVLSIAYIALRRKN